MAKNGLVLELKPGVLPSTNQILIDRGMNLAECRAICTSPQIPLREKLFFRIIYETTTRPREVLEARIELWNRNSCEITFPKTKGKYNRWTRKHIPGSPKTMKLTQNTNDMLRHYVGNRKKGHVFINERTGKRLSLKNFEKEIENWAKLLNIQKLQSIKPGGKNYHLVTLMALREAGERHHDLNGGDSDVSAKAAGHSKETKARYYKKVSYEEAGVVCQASSCFFGRVVKVSQHYFTLDIAILRRYYRSIVNF